MPTREEHERANRDYENRILTTEAERIAIAAAKLALNDGQNEFMALFGVARGNAASVEEFRKDMLFARQMRNRPDIWRDLDFLASLRQGSTKAWARVTLTAITVITGAVIYGMGTGFVHWMKSLIGMKGG